MSTINDLDDLLLQQVKNLYAAEEHQLQAVPSIIKQAHHRSLKNALKHHLQVTEEHKNRLIQIIKLLDKKDSAGIDNVRSTAHVCKGMMGLVEEANDLLEGGLAADVTDAAIIAAVQKMEHYEICTYGTALAYSVQLHHREVEKLLRETLDEEYDADDLLTALATAALNKEAIPEGLQKDDEVIDDNTNEALYTGSKPSHKTSSSERTINSPGGRAGTSHRRYPSGESRGH